MNREETATLPMGDARFFDILMPYEIRLAQRRTLDRSLTPGKNLPPIFTGLYLIQPVLRGAVVMPAEEDGGSEIRSTVETLIRSALRDSDIFGRLEGYRLLALVRDLEPQHAYVVAQRMLSAFNRSEPLREIGVGIRIGYVIYPLASQANLPPSQWPR
ncbi:MAG TPA: diguanylate cyclase, partial [Acidobacteria bacterium]|nr:diguanylate cyclase [Acidobacteriota bacterium]